MHKLFFSFLGILFLALTVYGQDTTYVDKQWRKTKKKNAIYIQVIEKMPDGYLLKEFTLKKQILTEGLYKDKYFGMPCGYYCSYFDNGKKEIEVNYNLDGGVDETKYYYPSGELKLKSSGNKSQLFRKNGSLKRVAILEGNEWIAKCFSGDGNDSICIDDNTESKVKTESCDWSKYVAENLKYPQQALEKGLRGYVIIDFHVNSIGRAINPRVLFGTDTLFNKEAIRLVREKPLVEPIIVDGHPILVEYSVTIKFSLSSGP